MYNTYNIYSREEFIKTLFRKQMSQTTEGKTALVTELTALNLEQLKVKFTENGLLEEWKPGMRKSELVEVFVSHCTSGEIDDESEEEEDIASTTAQDKEGVISSPWDEDEGLENLETKGQEEELGNQEKPETGNQEEELNTKGFLEQDNIPAESEQPESPEEDLEEKPEYQNLFPEVQDIDETLYTEEEIQENIDLTNMNLGQALPHTRNFLLRKLEKLEEALARK